MNWIEHTLTLTGRTELLGGMPKSEDLIEAQMSSKEVRLRAKLAGRSVEHIVADNLKDMGIEEGLETLTDQDRMARGFRKNAEGALCIGNHQIPAMLADAMTTLRLGKKVAGLKDILTRGLVVGPERLLPIYGENGPATEPTTVLEWGHQVQDRMGSRAVLERYDAVFPWALRIEVKYPDTRIITKEIWADLWEMASQQGLGSARPKGYGRFTVEVG